MFNKILKLGFLALMFVTSCDKGPRPMWGRNAYWAEKQQLNNELWMEGYCSQRNDLFLVVAHANPGNSTENVYCFVSKVVSREGAMRGMLVHTDGPFVSRVGWLDPSHINIDIRPNSGTTFKYEGFVSFRQERSYFACNLALVSSSEKVDVSIGKMREAILNYSGLSEVRTWLDEVVPASN